MLTLSDGRSELWQWDTGRKLTVDAECSQVHFSNKVFGRSIDVDVVDGVVDIPDILLQTDKELTAWSFVGTAENGYTEISKVFKVNRRNKPADYVFTPPEQTTLAEIMERLDDLESIQDPDAIKNAVDDYLANNPVIVEETDPTVPEWAKQPDPPDVKIPDKLPNPYSITFTGAVNTSYDGSSPVEIKIPDSGGNVDWLDPEEGEVFTAIVDTPDEPDAPDVPDEPEVTLSSISATYTGGNVAVGTAVTALTGITVTAHYSDGSSETVTDFTLSGTIADGSNTITVSYGGKTTTFTVIGVEEDNGEDFTGTENAFIRDGYLYINPLTITPMFDRTYDADTSDYHKTIYKNGNGAGLFDNSALSDGTIFNGVVKQTASSADEPYYVDADQGNAWLYIPLDDWNASGGSPETYLYSLTERFPIKLASAYSVFDFNNSDMGTIVQGSKYKTEPSISNGFIVGAIFLAMDINWHPVCNVNGFTFTSGETECYNIAPYASGWTTFSFSIPSTAFDNDLNNVSIASIVEYVRSIGLKFWGGAA